MPMCVFQIAFFACVWIDEIIRLVDHVDEFPLISVAVRVSVAGLTGIEHGLHGSHSDLVKSGCLFEFVGRFLSSSDAEIHVVVVDCPVPFGCGFAAGQHADELGFRRIKFFDRCAHGDDLRGEAVGDEGA